MSDDVYRKLEIASAYALNSELSSKLKTLTFTLLADIADAMNGNQDKEDIIGGNFDAFKPLLTQTVYLSIVQICSSCDECKAVANERPALKAIMSDGNKFKEALKYLRQALGVGKVEDTYTAKGLVEAFTTYNPESKQVAGYDPEVMSVAKEVIKAQIIDCWKGIYEPFVNGLETMDGVIIPAGVLSDSKGRESQGMISTTSKEPTYKIFPYANAIYEEFIGACKDVGLSMVASCATDVNDSTPFRYNPKLQWRIATGYFDRNAYRQGWKAYTSAVLDGVVDKIAERIAVIKERTGLDDEIYKAQSTYCTSLAVINYKHGLGFQIRACCGVNNKGEQFAKRFIQRLQQRESGNRSLNFGKATFGDAALTPGGGCVFSVYLDKEAYYRIPDFMGEHLMKQENFTPSMSEMIIGRKLNNTIMKLDMESGDTGWCVPIIAGSRSGKGVLTLNILLNVFACGIPLFYLDGKPDMSALFSQLAREAGVQSPMIVDCIKYKGVTPIDHKAFSFGYADTLEKWIRSPEKEGILSKHITVMTYIKMLAVIRMTVEYNNNVMHGKSLFVVTDEVFAFSQKVNDLYKELKLEISKMSGKENKERKAELQSIVNWLDSIFSDYVSAGIGVFGNGIKVLALSQYDAVGSYSTGDSTKAFESFASTVGLKGGGKCRIYGKKQEASSKGTYSWDGKALSNSDTELISKYRHFAVTSGGTAITHDDIFKPLLVLNECDAVEYKQYLGDTTATEDGPFVGNVVAGVPSDSRDAFRQKYFQDPRTAASIGFEGALQEIARCSGKSPKEMMYDSFEGASRLATEALAYYGVLGHNGIETVYDYLTSTSVAHLWTIGEIMDAFNSGRELGPAGQNNEASSGLAGNESGDDGASNIFSNVEARQEEPLAMESQQGAFDAMSTGESLDDEQDPWSDIRNTSSSGNVNLDLGISPETLSALGISQGIQGLESAPINSGIDHELARAASEQRQQWDESLSDGMDDTMDNMDDAFGTDSMDDTMDEMLGADNTTGGFDTSSTQFNGSFDSVDNMLSNQSTTSDKWKDVPDDVVEGVVTNMLDAVPDNADSLEVMSLLLQDDVANNVITPDVAEAVARKYNLAQYGYTTGYDYAGGNVQVIPKDRSNMNYSPYMEPSSESMSAVRFTGKRNNNIKIDADRTKVKSLLNDQNSIDCRSAGVGRLSFIDRTLLGTPKGAQRYINKLWDSILTSAIDQGYKPAIISRAVLYDDNITLNGKVLILDGIIGGRDDIRLTDIVNFRLLFRRFPMIRTITIDTGFLQSAITEFGDDVVGNLFALGSKLESVEILTNNNVLKCTRQKYMSDKRVQKEMERAKLNNHITMECKSKNPASWDENTPGNNIWGMRLARSSMGRASAAFQQKNKPGIGKAIAYGTIGIVGGTIGATLWGLSRGIKGIFGMRKSFKG